MSEEEYNSGYVFVKGETRGDNSVYKEERIFVIEVVNPIEENGVHATEKVKLATLDPLAGISKYIYERTILITVDVFIDEAFFETIYMTENISRKHFEEQISEYIEGRKKLFK